MTNQPKHSSTPWRVTDGGCQIRSGETGVATLRTIYDQDGGMQANAAFIVLSANIHYEMLAALKDMTKRYDNLEKIYAERTGMLYDAVNGSIARAENIIARAERRAE